MRVKALADEAVSEDRVLLAVFLDIANAFNILLWRCIRRALIYHRVPSYLRLLGAYLRGRRIKYHRRYGVPT